MRSGDPWLPRAPVPGPPLELYSNRQTFLTRLTLAMLSEIHNSDNKRKSSSKNKSTKY